jgi:hypothetical protein
MLVPLMELVATDLRQSELALMMPDLVVQILHHQVDAPMEARRSNTMFVGWRVYGTHLAPSPTLAPTGRIIHTDGITFVRLCEPVDDAYELSECMFWRVFDWQDVFAQAGSFPARQVKFDK